MPSEPLQVTDERLLQDLVLGHDAAYEVLVLRHRRDLARTATAILKNREDAEDVLQQALLRAYERAHQYRGEAPARIWLRRLVVSACLDHLRRRRVRAFLLPWVDGLSDRRTSGVEDDLEGRLGYDALRECVDRAIRLLPARQRAIFSLRVYEEWSLPEIAESLGVDVGTVKTHLFRATRRVRNELERDGIRAAPTAIPALPSTPGQP